MQVVLVSKEIRVNSCLKNVSLWQYMETIVWEMMSPCGGVAAPAAFRTNLLQGAGVLQQRVVPSRLSSGTMVLDGSVCT